MERPLRGPDIDRPHLTSKEAGAWIADGISEDLFEDLMALHLPTVAPVWVGKFKFWRWMDVAVLCYVLTVAGTVPPKGRRESGETGK
jgi:hypothetical protein